jgi:hypothetical protein
MSKRSREAANASPSELPIAPHTGDEEDNGAEDGDGSELKKPRTFMATLVRQSHHSTTRMYHILTITGVRKLSGSEEPLR